LLPFLGAFLIAAAQMTIIGVSQTVVNNAAFEGARIGGIKGSTAEARNAANNIGKNILSNWSTNSKVNASIEGGVITVTVEYTFPRYSYFSLENINIPAKVQASASQRVESRP
jgi:uncharacterized membrane protein